MKAGADISDSEHSDSEYARSDLVEDVFEGLTALSLEDPKSLGAKIQDAIPDAKPLGGLIFQIRNSPLADDLIIDIVDKIVDGGYEDSYHLMAPELFKQAQLSQRTNMKPEDEQVTSSDI